jgi:hypothetical protein
MWERYSGSLLRNQPHFKCKELVRFYEEFYTQKRYCNVFGDVAENVLARNNEKMYFVI